MATDTTALRRIDPDLIDPNPENPRLIFREEDMNQLLESIKEVGIRVPLSVYRQRNRFVLIDGERRWRCARRLNLKSVPALVQPKPGQLENLLTMFNIHNVRVDWDLMPMALKLERVGRLLEAEGKPSAPKDVAGATGLSLATVNRALDLLELPKRYRDLLLSEAEKPRDQQQIKPDLFIEINKSKRVVRGYAPEVFKRVSEAQYLDAFVNKYRKGVVNNVVRFRDISRIARGSRAGADTSSVVPTLVQLVVDPQYRIEDAYRETVEGAYLTRDTMTRVTSLVQRLREIRAGSRVARDLTEYLRDLREQIDRLLGDA